MPGLKTAEKVIGAHTYKVTTLGALTGRVVFSRMLKLLGGSVDGLTKDNLPGALRALADNLTDADLAYLCDTFGKSSDVVLADGRAPRVADVFDMHFSDNYWEMCEWLVFCLEVNFSSFFRGLRDALARGDFAKQVASAIPAKP